MRIRRSQQLNIHQHHHSQISEVALVHIAPQKAILVWRIFKSEETHEHYAEALDDSVEDPPPEDPFVELFVSETYLVVLGIAEEFFFGVFEVHDCKPDDWH